MEFQYKKLINKDIKFTIKTITKKKKISYYRQFILAWW